MLVLKDIVSEFRKYSNDHPFKILCEICFNEDGLPDINKLGDYWWAINTIQAVGRALSNLHEVSDTAYSDMVRSKLKAKDKDSYNRHGLISAMAELSVMNTFIIRSTDPQSFRYEDRVREDSNRNVEFSINMDKYIFHVEVKTSNLLLENQAIGNLLQSNDEVLVLDGRDRDYTKIIDQSKIPVRGCLDRRILDFLQSANDKFLKSSNSKEINLLVICWDDRVKQPLLALKNDYSEGLLTEKSFARDENGNPLTFNNIDCILVNSNYAWFEVYVNFLLKDYFTPNFPVDPFFQVFAHNFIIDHNLTDDRINMLNSIIQQKANIVDSEFANSLPKFSIAHLKEGTNNVISFVEHSNIPNRIIK